MWKKLLFQRLFHLFFIRCSIFRKKYFKTKAIVVGPGIKTGLIVKYDNPKLLGSDRIVNAVAAIHQYPAPLIVIDFGTATTFCAVSEKAEYFRRRNRSGESKFPQRPYLRKTAKLPRVDLEAPGHTLCRNTSEGIQGRACIREYGNGGIHYHENEKRNCGIHKE